MEALVEGVVAVVGAALAVSTYREVKRQIQGSNRDPVEDGCMKGRVVVVTGANTGIGYAAAELMTRKGAEVILACRTVEKAETAATSINRRLRGKNGVGVAHASTHPLDLSSLQSVQQFARAFRQSGRPLHVLVNNAGAMFRTQEAVDVWPSSSSPTGKKGLLLPPSSSSFVAKREQDDSANTEQEKKELAKQKKEEEGKGMVVASPAVDVTGLNKAVEKTMVVNHLGPWLLTVLLYPLLKETGRKEGSPARIIMVSSCLEKNGDKYLEAWLEDPAMQSSTASAMYTPFKAYGASKLANLLVVAHLDNQRQGQDPSAPHEVDPSDQHVTIQGCTPGMVHTNLARWAPWSMRVMTWPLRYLVLKSKYEGARPIVYLAASERVEGRGGGFWAGQTSRNELYEVVEIHPSLAAQDTVMAEKLWTLSEELAVSYLPTSSSSSGAERSSPTTPVVPPTSASDRIKLK